MPLGPLPQTEALEDNPLGTEAVENDQDFNQSSFDADVDKLSYIFFIIHLRCFSNLTLRNEGEFWRPFLSYFVF